MPALHRDEMRGVLSHIYSVREEDRFARNSYFLFIVFAIGATIRQDPASSTTDCEPHQTWCETRPSKRQKLSLRDLSTPEHYHAAAMAYLERSLSSSPPSDRLCELEELQAMILLASFALVRPTTPRLGRLVDVAMHLDIDLRLYGGTVLFHSRVIPSRVNSCIRIVFKISVCLLHLRPAMSVWDRQFLELEALL